ncbi:uncharacterized protein FMAN_08430 [Fusarium mangiferae]|uniref:C2H2-type domain-containing protein n=1 Tax=Fusarium mangiferae TaxID=192010 RepID=A0A1L7TPQ9_FUSMA|nr:uncharacterized protein FMAN_08430 [Fusarium mangiferae]CVK98802.1 uncharacterized protein FMAN_08430 [Fusarium mangiferae]
MAYVTERWVCPFYLYDYDRQEKERLDPLTIQYVKVHLQQRKTPIKKQCSSLSDVKTVYASLVKVEEACTRIGKAQPRNIESNLDPNLEQWEALQAIHHTLLHQHNELPIASSTLSPQLREFRKIAYDHSLQSRSLRRFSDCLLPLLKREQDLESARQWLELMNLSSSLLEILGKNDLLFTYEEMTLMNLIDQIEAILERLKQWFRCRYEDLSCMKDATEEQGLAEPIFEFPNNIRHTCTTMPWTILPALLVLWGVCWMFIIGCRQPEHEWGNAADPIISPVPAAHDFHAEFYGIGIEAEGPQASVADGSDNRRYLSQDTLEELWAQDVELMNELIHPLTFAQTIPQDPNFLNPDMTSRGDSERLELASQDPAEILPAAALERSNLMASISADNSGEADATGNADSSGDGHRTINSDDKVEETKAPFACPDCQRTFARPFTLNRHRTEKHRHASILVESLLCPNRGCKRSKGKPFKRGFHLKRHVDSCKHSQEDLGQGNNQSRPRSASTSTPATAITQHRQDFGPDEAIRDNGMKERPRAEEDERSNDKYLLAEMVKKYKRLEQEIKEKQDDLKALGKTIQMLGRS